MGKSVVLSSLIITILLAMAFNSIALETLDSCISVWMPNDTWSPCDTYEFQYRNFFDLNNCNNLSILENEYRSCDYDGDGFIGNSSSVKTNDLNLTISVESTTISFSDGNDKLLEFHNFNSTSLVLNLTGLSMYRQPNTSYVGYFFVSGFNFMNSTYINLTKTMYIDRLLDNAKICVKYGEISSINEITTECRKHDEMLMECPGSNSNTTCEIISDGTKYRYRVSGLPSGVTEQSYFCGDGECKSGMETCSSCQQDCGSCENYAQGWYFVPNDFNFPENSTGQSIPNARDGDFGDGNWVNLSHASCVNLRCLFANTLPARGGSISKGYTEMWRGGFSEGTYSLRPTVYGIDPKRNFTMATKDSIESWSNYTVGCTNMTYNSYYCNITTDSVNDWPGGGGDGVGIPAYVNSSGMLYVRLWTNATGGSDFIIFSAMHVVNYTPQTGLNRVFVTPSNFTVVPDGRFNVTVNISAIDNIYAAQFHVFYDRTKLSVVNTAEGNFLAQDGASTYATINNDYANGRIIYGNTRFGAQNGTTGNGSLLTIEFRALSPGVGIVGLSAVALSDPNLEPLSHKTDYGIVRVNTPPILSWYSPANSIIKTREGFKVRFSQTSTDPDPDPLTYSWTFNGTEQTTATEWLFFPNISNCGTANVTINVSDGLSSTLMSWAVKIDLRGDVDGNRVVDIFDLATAGLAFYSTVGSAEWNANADLSPGPRIDGSPEGDGRIDIFDLAAMGLSYGSTC